MFGINKPRKLVFVVCRTVVNTTVVNTTFETPVFSTINWLCDWLKEGSQGGLSLGSLSVLCSNYSV